MTSYLDIPPHARGTVVIGGTQYHYDRGSAKVGHALHLRVGPDTRDWDKIDAGALDYSAIARQEHDVAGFMEHDGPRIKAACPVCNSPEGTDAVPVKDVRAAQVSLARQDHQSNRSHRLPDVAAACPICHPTDRAPDSTLGPVPDTLPPEVAERVAAMRAEQLAAEAQAAADNELKAKLPPLTGNAEAIAAAETREARIARLEAELDAERARDINDYDDGSSSYAADPQDRRDQAEEETDEAGRPVWGVDPFNHERVKIMWNITGADPDHPYGKKADGSPRRRVGSHKTNGKG